MRESNLQRGIADGIIADLKNGNSYSARERHILGKEIDELKAELEKNIAARSRLKEMLAEARKSSPEIITTPGTIQNAPKIPASLLSERTAKKPATKPNASQEQ